MVYQDHVMDDLFENLRKLMNHSCFLHSKYNFDAEILNLKVEEHIRCLLVCCQEFRDIGIASPVVLSPDLKAGVEVTELRTVISILFAFLRQPAPDREFTRHIKQWLEKCVALQLRLATWHDHLFLLYHVLRCPAGVPSWAALFVQIPKSIDREERGGRLSLFDNSLVSHTIVLLSVVLTPITGRNQFLEKVREDRLNFCIIG
jgi:ectopic P granules protein 5